MRQLLRISSVERLGYVIAAAICLLVLALRFALPIDVLYPLEAAVLNAGFHLRGARDPGHEVVIVVVDEKSLKEQGRWPWSRATQAALVQEVAQQRPRVIGLDLIYSESSPNDAALADSLTAVPVVLSFALHVAKDTVGVVPADAPVPESVRGNQFMLVRPGNADAALAPYQAYHLDPPVPILAARAAAQGHVYFIPDRDGLTRHEYLALRYGDAGDIYPSFALEIARVFLGLPKDQEILVLGDSVRLGDRVIPVDQKARLLIDYAGPERSFRYVSATDVLQHRIDGEVFRDRAVLVGTVALGTYDQKATAFSGNFPAVEKNATVIENILHRSFLSRTVWAGPIDALAIVLFAAALGALLPRISPVAGAGVVLAMLVGYAALLYGLFVGKGLWLDLVYPGVVIVVTFLGVTVSRLATRERQAEEIRAIFSSYVSPPVVEELIRDPRKATIGGHHKDLTMVFCDLIGFTAFAETQAADAAVEQLNEFLSAMTDVVFHWHGTLDKYVGDSIVAFWGAPLEQPNHPELGVKCALDMRRRLRDLQKKWALEGRPALDAGIGINSGTAIVGNIGAEGKKLNYTMIGDHVNLAARVQELTRQYQCPIIITESTLRHLDPHRLGHISLRGLGEITIRGRAHAVSLYALESLPSDEPSVIEVAIEPTGGSAPAPPASSSPHR